jgi:hypothetical protein
MTLRTDRYAGKTVKAVMESLDSDEEYCDFIFAHDLSRDVTEAVASMMVTDDPTIVAVTPTGEVFAP